MSDKLEIAREAILNLIESGELCGGAKLPAAREFSEKSGISFTVVQMAFNSLTRDGILSSVSRQGTYVRNDWRERILPGSFQTFRPVWKSVIETMVTPQVPGIRICDQFVEGAFEIRTSGDVQARQQDYLDLTECFEAEFADKSDLFMNQFESFRGRNGKLYAIPLIYSPWVLCYNPELFRKAGVPEPYAGWSWGEFMMRVRELRKSLPVENVLNFYSSFWLNFLYRAGGCIIDRVDGQYQVKLDDPNSIRGLSCSDELFAALDRRVTREMYRNVRFWNGECAMMIAGREDCDHSPEATSWKCVPLPMIPGGVDRTRQACDLLCVRRVVNDFDQIRGVIRRLLSPEVQEYLGRLRYGIPIRRTAAIRTFDENDSRDAVFFSEMTKICVTHHFAWPEIHPFAENALNSIWNEGFDLRQIVAELAPALRTVIHNIHS